MGIYDRDYMRNKPDSDSVEHGKKTSLLSRMKFLFWRILCKFRR